jgi:hypothetical protein
MLIVSIGILSAVESDPSATVGYFKKSVSAGGIDAFSHPFFDADMTIGTVLGDQFADMDAVTDINSALGTEYYDGFGWYGDLEEIAIGASYWIARSEANGDLDFYLAGTVNPQPVTVMVPAMGITAFALNEPKDILIADLPITGVCDMDAVTDISTALGTEYYDGFGWYGDLEYIEPTHAYWYATTSDTDFDWTYTPGARQSHNPPARNKTSNKK